MSPPLMEEAFVVFPAQDSGCVSFGVAREGKRWFVKRAVADQARASLARAASLHRAVQHEAIVRPHQVYDGADGATLVYPWIDGQVLNHSTTLGSDRTALERFRALPTQTVLKALDRILDAHLSTTAAGWIAVDLYDGCFLYDFEKDRVVLVDLDEYRPGPFVLGSDRLPGSKRFMAPEEFRRGATIDERTTVHALGRTLQQLFQSQGGWRGTTAQLGITKRATHQDPELRYPSVSELVGAWRETIG